MILSRFWYVIVAIALSACVASLLLASRVYNRSSRQAVEQALTADIQVVGWYLNDDARRRSSQLLTVCLDETVRKQLSKASATIESVPKDSTLETRAALQKLVDAMPAESRFDALFAVDQLGRVVGVGEAGQRASNIAGPELGGYSIVADALHGWVRDDMWVFDGQVYLVVTRPVEIDTAQMPAGAIVGVRAIDNEYVRQLARRTGAVIGFFDAQGSIKSRAAPEGLDATKLDDVRADVAKLAQDRDFAEKGKSKFRQVMDDVGVVYSKIPGEAWDLGAGYVVARPLSKLSGPFAFLDVAVDDDKKSVEWWAVVLVFLIASFGGLALTLLEHSRPLHALRLQAQRMAKGEINCLPVARFRGAYRRIASDLNDGFERAAAESGAPRKAADLESVLGPIPAQPAMSAFSFPLESISSPAAAKPAAGLEASPPVTEPSASKTVGAQPVASTPSAAAPPPPRMSPPPAPVIVAAAPVVAPALPESMSGEEDATVIAAVPDEVLKAARAKAASAVPDEQSEWRAVFDEFLRTKKQCGEPTSGLTFEKFQLTLGKNRDQLIAKTGCKKVRFTVYVKDNRAALKASPVKT